MKFSAITISYNHAEFVERTIQSVLEQNYPDFEHIVIDGGSADGSIEIFKKYPHLNWVSEPDLGVSHALNKGIAKATGDVIAWINSDDFYAPNAFALVAEAIKNSPVVLGNAWQTDRAGNPNIEIKNIPRTLYDLEKYWVPNAWLAQPSVFFTRDAIESVKLCNGAYLDETFKYAMDFDLWMRLAEKYPFTNYVPKTLSYFRVYGENLTGQAFASQQRELGRAFHKSFSRRFPTERSQEIILPVLHASPELGITLDSLVKQDLHDFQITFLDMIQDAEGAKRLKGMITLIEEATTLLTLRHIRVPELSIEQAIDRGLKEATGEIISVIQVGDTFESYFTTRVFNLFAHDPYGAAMYLDPKRKVPENLKTQKAMLNPDGLLEFPYEKLSFSVRRGLYEEVQGYLNPNHSFSLPEFFLKLIAKGWVTPAEDSAGIHSPEPKAWVSTPPLYVPYQRATLYAALTEFVQNEPYQDARTKSGHSPHFSNENLPSIKEFLSTLRDRWSLLAVHDKELSLAELKWIVEKFPRFAPAWYYLEKRLKDMGEVTAAETAKQNFIQLRPDFLS